MLLLAIATPVSARSQAVPGTAPPGQAPLGSITVCGLPVPSPSKDPPPDSGPLVLAMLLCFEKQGGASMIDPETYLYYIQVKPSEPSRDRWIRYDAEAERVILGDFRRLWATNFLEDLVIDVQDYPLANGVVGKVIVFSMEERQRVKIVDYEGSRAVSQSDIDSRLKDKAVTIRLDSFLDPALIRRVSSLVRELYAEKGYQFVTVTPVVSEVEGGTKLVNVTFRIAEGPRVAIRDVEFLGNRHISDDRLEHVLKANRPQGLLSITNGSGTYKEDKFADDAEAIESYYRDRGYISAEIGQPEIRPLDDSADGRTRWVQLRIPVTEGRQYVVGNVQFAGHTILTVENLLTLFKLKSGEVYSQQVIAKGLEKAREVYGAAGHYEFTAYPDLKPREQPSAFSHVIARHEREAAAAGVSIQTLIREGADHVAADPHRIEQVIDNLVANAIRHTAPGGTVYLEAARSGDRAVLWVIDSGDGIAPEHLPHVFDRFYKVDAARAASPGSGLGLTIARAIVQRHGGLIQVASVPGRTEFWFELPQSGASGANL